MTTRSAGVREIKAHLSKILADVKNGHEWVISDRGAPVARLVPYQQPDLTFEERVAKLVSAGLLERRERPARPICPPIKIKNNPAQRYLQEDRDR